MPEEKIITRYFICDKCGHIQPCTLKSVSEVEMIGIYSCPFSSYGDTDTAEWRDVTVDVQKGIYSL